MEVWKVIKQYPANYRFRIYNGNFLAVEAKGKTILTKWPKHELENDVVRVIELPHRKVSLDVFGHFSPIEAIIRSEKC